MDYSVGSRIGVRLYGGKVVEADRDPIWSGTCDDTKTCWINVARL